jgi:dihydrofolate reductase
MLRTAHPDGKAWVEETLWRAGAPLAGRGLYTSWVGYWPTSTDPIAAPMNAIPKIAFSRSGKLDPAVPTPPGWDDTRVLGTDLAADIDALKAEPGKDLVAQGGASFGRSLVQLGLVDEYRLVVHPVVLGSGLPLFRDAKPFDLTLIDATTLPSGTQALVYQPNCRGAPRRNPLAMRPS